MVPLRYGRGEGAGRFAFDKYLLSRLDLLFFSKRCKFDEREREGKRKEKEEKGKRRNEEEVERRRGRERQKKVKFFKNGVKIIARICDWPGKD